MRNNYRINWKSGMKLSDAVFNASDEFHISQLSPLFELMLKSGYGHLSQPRFRCDVDNAEMSVIEVSVSALTPDGSYINVRFDHNERDLFQKIAMPETHEPFIVYLEQSASEFDTFEDKGIPYKEHKYNLIFKQESLKYTNPEAIALARFTYKQCWTMDNSFIAPCITLKANADLWNYANSYSRILTDLSLSLQSKLQSETSMAISSINPIVAQLSIEIRKELDEMSPKHLITVMQQVINIFLMTFATGYGSILPDVTDCSTFVENEYIPYNIEPLVKEGIRLTQLMAQMVAEFRQPVAEPREEPVLQRPLRQPRTLDTSSERKSFKTRK